MRAFSDVFGKIKKSHLQITGVFALIVLAFSLLWFNNSTSAQAGAAFISDIYFEGEYSIGGGPSQPIKPGEHISATEGDVTLIGNFREVAPDGTDVGIYRGELPIAFYLDHINITLYEGLELPFVSDVENPEYKDSACCESYESCPV